MHRKMTGRAAFAALTLAASCLFAATWSAGPAEAAGGSSDTCPSSGGSSGGGSGSGSLYQIWLALNVHTDMCPGGGNLIGGPTGQAPHIPCWWGKVYDPQGLRNAVESFAKQGSTSNWYMMLKQEYDENGSNALDSDYTSTKGPPWESYNIGAKPPGDWYGMIYNQDDTLDELKACTDEEDAQSPKIYYWGVNDKTPTDLPTAVPGFGPLELAMALKEMVMLPSAPVLTNPQVTGQAKNTATVGVPVWFWQPPGEGKTTRTIKDICAYGACVKFVAQATSFTISSTGPHADVDSSGCTLNADAGYPDYLGVPYQSSDGNARSRCGIDYKAPGQAGLAVTTSWQIKVSWTGGSWSTQGSVYTPLGPVQVQEIQAYNPSSAATP